jgi:ferredoxin
MKIRADINLCIGAGQCATLAPDTFSQGDDDGLVIVLNATPDESKAQRIQDAVHRCPTRALSIINDD